MRMHRLEGTLPNGNRDDRPQQRRPANARQHCSAPTWEVSRRQRPASQISFCRSGTPPEEVNRRRNWPSCVGSRPGRAFLRSLHGSSLSPFPKLDPVCSPRNFRGQRFSEFLTDCRPVTSEVAGSSPVVPAIPFQRFPSLFKYLQWYAVIRLATPCDTNRHEMPPILGSNCSSYCSTWAGDPMELVLAAI